MRTGNLSIGVAALCAVWWAAGCGNDEPLPQGLSDPDSAYDGGIDAGDPSADASSRFGVTALDGSDAPSDAPADRTDGAAEASDARVGDATDGAPPPPATSRFCGDGIRDPMLEECD